MDSARINELWKRFASRWGEDGAAAVFREVPGPEELDERRILEMLSSPERLAAYAAITSERRRLEWLAARSAELELRAALGPDALTSVSHSEGALLVAGCRSKDSRSGITGIGVDLEVAQRALSDAAWGWLMSGEDRACWSGERLIAWALKEAAFKADPDNEGEVLSRYLLTEVDHQNSRARLVAPSGKTGIEASWGHESGWLIVFAAARTIRGA